MTRILRIEFPVAVYHATYRVDLREPITTYDDDKDQQEFLSTLADLLDG